MPKRLQLVYLAIIVTLAFNILSFASNSHADPYNPVTQDLIKIDKQHPPSFYEVFIPIDNVQLTGFILTANGKGPHPTMVLVHGLPGNEKNLDVAQSLRRAGFNILFFHYRGSWGSEGDYSFLTLHKDVLAALDFLRKNAAKYKVDINHLSVAGHSFGGYAVLRAASIDKHLSCAIGISAANPAMIASSERVNNDFNNSIGGYIDKLFMLRNFSGKQATKELLQQANKMDTRKFAKGLKGKQVLLVVGSEDTVVPPIVQQKNVDQYTKENDLKVTAITIPGDHAFSVSRIKLQQVIVDWSKQNCI